MIMNYSVMDCKEQNSGPKLEQANLASLDVQMGHRSALNYTSGFLVPSMLHFIK